MVYAAQDVLVDILCVLPVFEMKWNSGMAKLCLKKYVVCDTDKERR